MVTEMLSDVVARKRLRAAKSQIIQATKAARSKRIELEESILNHAQDEIAFKDISSTNSKKNSKNTTSHNKHSNNVDRHNHVKYNNIIFILSIILIYLLLLLLYYRIILMVMIWILPR
jgi:hypothetical protein